MESTVHIPPPRHLEFVYDIACPYAYLGSRQVEAAAERCGATLTWTPVLLGGLYDGSKAPKFATSSSVGERAGAGKAGSATDVMSKSKQKLLQSDLRLQAAHIGAPLTSNSRHPLRTVSALRVLLAARESSRPLLTHTLYKAYWVDDRDVSDENVLRSIVSALGLDWRNIESPGVKDQLRANTDRFIAYGAFGVPCFLVGTRLFWGQDRLHFVERALGRREAEPRRLPRFVCFGGEQVERVCAQTGASLTHRPVLVGALFRAIGTPDLPMAALSHAKLAHAVRDYADWNEYIAADLRWPTVFPIRSVSACRVAIAEPRAAAAVYRAAWVDDRDIANEAVLKQVLDEAGFDGDRLLANAAAPAVKEELRKFTSEAIEVGACGTPTFHVSDSRGRHVALLWGQDRLNVVSDLLLGWRPNADVTNHEDVASPTSHSSYHRPTSFSAEADGKGPLGGSRRQSKI